MKTKIALILAGGVISLALYLGVVFHDQHIMPEKASNVPVAEAPKVLLPFSYGENHITDWSRLFGGATPDARPVKTIVIPSPAK